MKRKIIRYFGIAFICIGIIIIAYPFYTNFVAARRESTILQSWDDETELQIADVKDKEKQDSDKLSRETRLVDPEEKLPFKIMIPAIDLEWTVKEGTDSSTLKKGPGFFISSTLPGEIGTTVVCGHRTTYGAPFNRIDELKNGDEIIIETSGNELFKYYVTDKKEVSPTDVSVLKNTDYPSLVLSTCTPKYFAIRRLIVFASME